MTPEERSMLQAAGTSIWKNFQLQNSTSVPYGILAPLTITTIHRLVIYRGLSSNSTKATVAVIVFSFLAATGVVISTIAANLGTIAVLTHDVVNTPLQDAFDNVDTFMGPWNTSSRWLTTFPPIVNDALIMWRAWAIFSGRHWAQYILAAMWIMSAGTTLASLIIYPDGTASLDDNPVLLNIASDLALTSTGLSFTTNLLATAFIAYILRGHLKLIKSQKSEPGLTRFRVWKVLMLLVDTGFIYCGLQLLDFIITVIPTSITSSLYQNGLIFNDAYLMISAFYPTLVTYLVHGLSPTDEIHEAVTVIYRSQDGREVPKSRSPSLCV